MKAVPIESGTINVTMSHEGFAPLQAISLALMCTRSFPALRAAPVTGSEAATSIPSGTRINAASSPIPPPTIKSLLTAPVKLRTLSRKISGCNLPGIF